MTHQLNHGMISSLEYKYPNITSLDKEKKMNCWFTLNSLKLIKIQVLQFRDVL